MPHNEYDANTNELFEVFDPLDALYEHLDTIEAEQLGMPQVPLIRALYSFLYTIPTFLAMNPGLRRSIVDGAEAIIQEQNDLAAPATALLQYLYALRNHDEFIDE